MPVCIIQVQAEYCCSHLAVFAAGIYFREFDTLHIGRAGYANWPFYIGGLLLGVAGLYCIATAGIRMEEMPKTASPAAAEPTGAASSSQSAADRSETPAARSGKELWKQLQLVVKVSSALQDRS